MNLVSREIFIPCSAVSTLLWDGDDLVDVTSGFRASLDGSTQAGSGFIGYPFDRAIGIRSHGIFWSVAYANRGTKGVLLRDGEVHRELNRSFNLANRYDFPIALALDSSGRAVLVHCPESFETLAVEDVETGKTLATAAHTTDMEFHSRLAASPCGRYLLDAGWFWHPLCGLWVLDLAALLADPAQTVTAFASGFGAEIDSAAFLGEEHLVVTSTDEMVNDTIPQNGLGLMKLGVWSLTKQAWRSTADLTAPSGAIMPWRDWVLAFHGYPRAIELSTGKVVHRWDHLYSGKQIGCIDLGKPAPPPTALDPQNGRFAISTPTGIAVVELSAE